MKTSVTGVNISPVNIKERQSLGLRAGDTVRVHQKIQDKGKTRIQIFEGLVLARKHGDEPGATFTVRKMASGVGVEKIYPLYSPLIDKIEIVKRAKVRRAKLYYIREKVAREIKRQMRRTTVFSTPFSGEAVEEEVVVAVEAEATPVTEAEVTPAERTEVVVENTAEAVATPDATEEAQ